MADIHHLISTVGLTEAKARSTDKLERQCLETAFAVMSDEQQRVGIMHAGFAMTALPHKNLRDAVWVRQGGNIKLRVESGTDADDIPVGIPFGSIPRKILHSLKTVDVRNGSSDIELGRSMNRWLAAMGIDNGGKTYRLVREQSKRLSLCRLTFYRVNENTTHITNSGFVRDAIIPTGNNNEQQLTLWREMVRLDEGFYQSLIEHPMPLLETAIRQIGQRSMAIDIYIWLAYRLHQLANPTSITWKAVFDQFGGGYAHLRQFKAKFKEPLALALAAYPQALVKCDDTGVTLYPSAPPVPKRPSLFG